MGVHFVMEVNVDGDLVNVRGISAGRLVVSFQNVSNTMNDLSEVMQAAFDGLSMNDFAHSMMVRVVPSRALVELLAFVLRLFGHVYVNNEHFLSLWHFCRRVDIAWLPEQLPLEADAMLISDAAEMAGRRDVDYAQNGYLRAVWCRSAQVMALSLAELVCVLRFSLPAVSAARFSRDMMITVYPVVDHLVTVQKLLHNCPEYNGQDCYIAMLTVCRIAIR